MPNSSLLWQAFSLPKRGSTPEEYEDAFAGDPHAGRFAIADGASESSFAGPWAKVVVDAFVQTRGSWSAWLPAARARWHDMFEGRDLPWFAEDKFAQGAFTTVLGVSLASAPEGGPIEFSASAVGDSCLFHIRNDALHCAFPMTRSTQFSNTPTLLGSRRRSPESSRTERKLKNGHCRPGDFLLLMTDALAQWFLWEVETGHKPWHALLRQNKKGLTDFVEELRDCRKLKNDDVTLLVICPDPSNIEV